jgi:hypothetical protein
MTTSSTRVSYGDKQLSTAAKNVRCSSAHAFANPDKYEFGIMREYSYGKDFDKCKLIDDYGYSVGGHNAKLFVVSHEFGASAVIHAQHDSEAWDAYIDEEKTIDTSELHEAYGFYLMQACKCFEQNLTAPWYVLCDRSFHDDSIGEIVSEAVLKCTGDRLTVGGAFTTKEHAQQFALEFACENECAVIEGYKQQSNSSGTGIVNVGHYTRIEPLPWNKLVIRHKPKA